MDKDVFDENGNYKKFSLLKQVDSHSGLLHGNTRATEPQAVDVDALKREVDKHFWAIWNSEKEAGVEHSIFDGLNTACVNAIIDHLASRNLIRGAVKPIDGLDDALREGVFDFNNGMDFPTHTQRDAVLEAAQAYNDFTNRTKNLNWKTKTGRFIKSKTDKERHGGPHDRGSADAYYSRPFEPHYYVGATSMSERIIKEQMTPEQVAEYREGFEQEQGRKDWGHD